MKVGEVNIACTLTKDLAEGDNKLAERPPQLIKCARFACGACSTLGGSAALLLLGASLLWLII